MLKAPAEFPFPGSSAFLAPTGAPVRIQRLNDDDTALISSAHPGASGNQTVARTRLHPTAESAILPIKPPRTRQRRRA